MYRLCCASVVFALFFLLDGGEGQVAYPKRSVLFPKPIQTNNANCANQARIVRKDIKIVGTQLTDWFYATEAYKFIKAELASQQGPADIEVIDISITTNDGHDIWQSTDETYVIRFDSTYKALNITAPTRYGARHALATIHGLLEVRNANPVHKNSKYLSGDVVLPISDTFYLEDGPAYTHRGVQLDTARWWLPVPVIMRQITFMSMAKLNVFHWHMSDDQSMPYIGPRSGPIIHGPTCTGGDRRNCKGAYTDDQTYNQTEVQTIIQHATQNGVRVIIEIDMPAHSRTWGSYDSSMLACHTAEYQTLNYCNEPICGVINLKDQYERVRDLANTILEDIAEVIVPGEYIHIGFDEINPNCWGANLTKTLTDKLLDDVSFNLYNLNNGVGRRHPVMLWHGAGVHADPPLAARVRGRDAVAEYWDTTDSTNKELNKLLTDGWNIVWASFDENYLDCGRGNPGSPSFDSWCRPGNSWWTMYKISPRLLVSPIVGQPAANRIIGGEAPAWSEQINEYNVDQIVWPRSAAMAEALWSPRPANLTGSEMPEVGRRLSAWVNGLKRMGLRTQPPKTEFCSTYSDYVTNSGSGTEICDAYKDQNVPAVPECPARLLSEKVDIPKILRRLSAAASVQPQSIQPFASDLCKGANNCGAISPSAIDLTPKSYIQRRGVFYPNINGRNVTTSGRLAVGKTLEWYVRGNGKSYTDHATLKAAVDDMMAEIATAKSDPVNQTLVAVLIDITGGSDTSTLLGPTTDEGYSIQTSQYSNDNYQAVITANTVYGARHGIVTLHNLLELVNVDIEGRSRYTSTAGGYFLPFMSLDITDRPKYPHRGIMVDTASSYISIEALKGVIRNMGFSKMNVFHWHMSDGNSFPLVGANSGMKIHGTTDCITGPCKAALDNSRVYLPNHVNDLRDYAKNYGVRVILETDMPTNTRSWGSQDSNTVKCFDKAAQTPSNCVKPPCGPLNLNDANSPAKTVMREVIQDLSVLTESGEYIHLGFNGTTTCWGADAMARKTEALTQVLDNVKEFDATRKGIFWHDVIDSTDATRLKTEGGVVQVTGNISDVKTLVDAGWNVIMSPWQFDLSCGQDAEHPERCGTDPTPVYKMWRHIYQIARNFTVYSPNPSSGGRLLGGEVLLWGTQMDSENIMELLWPRAAALSDALWADPMTALGDNHYDLIVMQRKLRTWLWSRMRFGAGGTPLQTQYCGYQYDYQTSNDSMELCDIYARSLNDKWLGPQVQPYRPNSASTVSAFGTIGIIVHLLVAKLLAF